MKFLIQIFLLLYFTSAYGTEGESQHKAPTKKPVLNGSGTPYTPEGSIAKINSDLDTLHQQTKSLARLYNNMGIGGKKALSIRIFETAKADYAKNEFRSVIRNLNSFLNLKQTPDIEWYLQAQHMLGISYKSLNQPKKSFRAFRRYLETLTTNPTYISPTATEVMKNFLTTVQQIPQIKRGTISQLLATVGTLKFPKEQKSLILFYSAKTLVILNKRKIALEWFAKSLALTNNHFVKARTLYNKALIHLHFQQYDQCYDDLKKIKDLNQEEIGIYKGWTNLSLARLHVFLRKPKTALSYYEKITDDSSAYKDALFELIYIYLDQKQSKDAVAAAEEFLKRFPNSDKTYQVSSLRAYFTLKDNNVNQTINHLKEGLDNLQNIEEWLQSNYQNRETISPADVISILNKTYAYLPTPPEMIFARDKYNELSRIKSRLAEIRNDMRHTIFTASRGSFDVINPGKSKRADQIEGLVLQLFQRGADLIRAERSLYFKKLSKEEDLIFKKAAKRRDRYWQKPFRHNLTNSHWKSWYSIDNMIAKLSKKYSKLKKTQAHIASLHLLTKTAKSITRVSARRNEISELKTKVDLIESDVLRGLEVLKARKIILTTSSTKLNILRNIVKEATDDILVERQILSKYRWSYSDPTDQYLAEDIDHTWKKWDNLVHALFENVVNEIIAVRDRAKNRLKAIDTIINEYDQLIEEHDSIHSNMSLTLGKHIGLILDHYYGQIEARKSQNQKWSADVKWLQFDNITLQKQKLLDKFSLEQQLLKENLKDLNQGALWSWPGKQKQAY